ncbi:cyclic nucleotide-binding domain-containing protein [Maritimibacter sp. UBA3975]|uniref:cyclic nucleotide-binding domain-containing protein n=1 Tax=Maritimibacter sp. UBA3975 TaxID=1946833 RepID=UPI000C09A9DF|nr:cyclic nucleotide-binding domain-containing protein [Maritimibacter sp. UBA3975]MAM63789.1 cyclic nucleotide-binding protein [Maritimibacter sp.]|tara:strand:- start:5632 stop:6318 length:687 start_codon:yes stop_codon:yes gene_type:complete
MDLTFLTDGFFGHLSYILLIVSSLMRRMFWLRLFVMGSAIAGIVFDWFMIGNVVGAFWQALLVIVNVVQIVLLWSRDRRAKFTEEERMMIADWLTAGTPGARRLLLDMGRQETLEPGEVLTEEGVRPRFLTYLISGAATVTAAGADVARIAPGHFVGEMSLMGDGLASATVQVSDTARVWQIERNKLDRMKVNQPELYGLIEAGTALNLRAKVLHGNRDAASRSAPAA